MQVREVVEADERLVAELNRLLPQLSTSASPLTEPQVAALCVDGAVHLLVAEDDGRLLGSLTLVVFPIPTGVRAWIEDVVVDEAARGRGVGAALNEFAIELARDLGAKTVDLTSRPSREPARRLYLRLGFERRETDVFRYDLKKPASRP